MQFNANALLHAGMYVCMRVYKYIKCIFIYIYVYARIYVWVYIYIYINVCVCVRARLLIQYTRMCACKRAYISRSETFN